MDEATREQVDELRGVERLADEADRFVRIVEASAVLEPSRLGGMGSDVVRMLEAMDAAGEDVRRVVAELRAAVAQQRDAVLRSQGNASESPPAINA